jgi:hypothetical protein
MMRARGNVGIFLAILIIVITAACGDSQSEGEEPGESGSQEGPQSQNNPAVQPGVTPDPSTPLTGALQIIGIDGFGIGQKSSAGFAALGNFVANETVLVAIKSDGQLEELSLPATADYDPTEDEPPQLKQILQLGSAGAVLQFNDFRYFRHTNALWIKSDGELRAFAPEGFTSQTQFFLEKFEVDLNGKMWVLGSDSLYSFDPEAETFSRYTDPNLTVRDFTITSDSKLYVYGLSPSNVGFLRRLLAGGGFEDIGVGAAQAGSGVALGRHLLNRDTLFTVNDFGLSSFFLPLEPGFMVRDVRGKLLTLPFVGSKWLLSYTNTDRDGNPSPRALNIQSLKVSANPLALSQNGARHARLGNGWTFDGVNITRLSSIEIASGDEQSLQMTTSETLPLRRAGLTPIRPVRAFGPLHGFTEYYLVLGRSLTSESFWVGRADATTGELTDLTPLTLGGASPSIFDIENYGHLLKLSDGRTYLVVGNNASSSVYVFSGEPGDSGVSAITLLPVSVVGFSADNDEYADSVIEHSGALYVGRRNGVFRYHPTDGSATFDLLRPGEPTNGSCLSTVIELTQTAENSPRPVVLRRGCDSMGATSDGLELLTYADFTFSSVAAAVSLNLTPTQTGEATLDMHRRPRLIPLDAGSQLLSVPTLDKAILIAWDSQSGSFSEGASASGGSVQTEGNRPFGVAFGPAARIDFATPWDGEAFFLTGRTTDQSRRSFRVDLATGIETNLSELTGVEVFTAVPGPKNTFWVSGNKTAANTNVILRFDADGTLVGQSAESGIQVLQLVPLGSE